MFEKEIMELTERDLYFVENGDAGQVPAITVDEAVGLVSATLPEGVEATGITVCSDHDRTWQVSISKPRRAAVHVDQYTGEIKGTYERSGFFSFMFRLHRWLLDSMKPGESVFWGRIIVGTSTLMFVPVLISGIVIWIPRTVRMLKTRLKISLRKGWKRFWYDLHVAGGIYAFVFLLAMALTGLTWSFPWYRTGFYKVFGADARSGRGGPALSSSMSASSDKDVAATEGAGVWQDVYECLAASNPGFDRITVSDGTASVSFDRYGNKRASDRYVFDKVSGEITGAALYEDASRSSKIRGWIYSVHVGSWGGTFTKVLTFIAALVGASLPLTGYWIWIRRLCRRKVASGVHGETS